MRSGLRAHRYTVDMQVDREYNAEVQIGSPCERSQGRVKRQHCHKLDDLSRKSQDAINNNQTFDSQDQDEG